MGGGKELYLKRRYRSKAASQRYEQPITSNMEYGWRAGRDMIACIDNRPPSDPMPTSSAFDVFHGRHLGVEREFWHKQPLFEDCIQLTHPRVRDQFAMPELERL